MKNAILILISIFLFASCVKDYDEFRSEPVNEYSHPRVSQKNQQVPLVPGFGLKSQPEDINYEFVLIAEVDAPEIDNYTLQATHVDIDGDIAYVSYNMRGPQMLGAIDVIDITNPFNIEIIETILFEDKNINAIKYYDGNLIYAGSDANGAFVAVNDTTIYIPSFSANSIDVNENWVYITSGDIGGGLTFLDLNTLEWAFMEFYDARSVSISSGWHVLTSNAIYKDASNPLITIDPDYIQYASKADIKVTEDYIFGALNRGGVYIWDESTLDVAFQVPRPLTPEGSESEDYVSNSISFNDLLFIANGGAGILVCGPENFVQWGYFDFGYDYSSNFVMSEGEFVFVATGLGGLKILTMVQIDDNPDDPTDPCEWQTETAFAGSDIGGGPAWWYYFDNTVKASHPIYAGQTLVEGAYATYMYGELTIELGDNMRLRNVNEPVKIQGYNEGNLPSFRPPAGLFTTYKGNDLVIDLPYYPYYVIHLDVEVCWE